MACDAFTKLMLHMNGADGSTTFTDDGATGHTVTAVGNAQIDTAQSKMGGASALFDGSGDRLTIPDHADWDFGTADWTIEMWVRFNATGSSFGMDTGQAAGVALGIYDTGGVPGFHIYVVGTEYYTSHSYSPSTGVWYHFCGMRTGNSLYHFIDGVQNGNVEDVTGKNITGLTNGMTVGATLSAQGQLNGWIDEYRVSVGVARYSTGGFTPQTTEFCDAAGQPYAIRGLFVKGMNRVFGNFVHRIAPYFDHKTKGGLWVPNYRKLGFNSFGLSNFHHIHKEDFKYGLI